MKTVCVLVIPLKSSNVRNSIDKCIDKYLDVIEFHFQCFIGLLSNEYTFNLAVNTFTFVAFDGVPSSSIISSAPLIMQNKRESNAASFDKNYPKVKINV